MIDAMCSDEFTQLTYTEKTEMVLKGTLLADRLTDHFYIQLYNVEQMYVEVFYDCPSHLIVHFRAFEHTMFVMPYLTNLKIAV